MVVTAGGLGVIASIVALLGFIGFEVLPLWTWPIAQAGKSIQVSNPSNADTTAELETAKVLAPRFGEDLNQLTVIRNDGRLIILAADSGKQMAELALPADPGGDVRPVAAARPKPQQVFWMTASGHLQSAKLQFVPPDQFTLAANGSWKIDDRAPQLLAVSRTDDGRISAVAAPRQGAPQLFTVAPKRSLFGAGQVQENRALLAVESGDVTAVAISGDAQTVYIGTSDGHLERWNVSDGSQPRRLDRVEVTATRDRPITAVSLLIGSRSIVVGDQNGELSGWSVSSDSSATGGSRLTRLHHFEALPAAITAIAPSPRDKRFAAAAADGSIAIYHSTSEQLRLKLTSATAAASLHFAPKANGLMVVDQGGALQPWTIEDAHPEVTTRTLFGKIWYEGYNAPAFVWQSTGGTDEFEPKLSLVPLIVGTMKGTLYSLLFAAPIAILAALYTSQFCHPRLRAVIKPTVEIMAALPSVVLGFLAGLWLAPLLEHRLPGVFALLLFVPLVIFLAGMSWSRAPRALHQRLLWPGGELVIIIPLLLLTGYFCLHLGPYLESWFFAGDFRHWLVEHGGRLDQRNCVIVGFALGFAVIPVIFTISEDALSNVPQRLVSGSLALGATRWQTALRVVLPTASAGIFSAVMVGFGRAVGETMIVLMATGNTPVLDWSVFTGMRTLSANIAVEIPEAPFGSTLYRVLFLAALMLFLTTFVVNTLAELVRQRLRRRYQSL